jgi:Methane oxygenase PmoA
VRQGNKGLFVKAKLLVIFLLLMVAAATLPGSAQSEAVKLSRQGDNVQVDIGGKPFTTYSFDPKIAKAYLQPLQTASGIVVTRDYPVKNTLPVEHEHDHGFEPHQRPLYFGHGDVNGYSFWVEEIFANYYKDLKFKYGRMVFRKLDAMKSGPSSGSVRATFDLTGGSGEVLGQETQSFVFRGDGEARTIDCEFVIKAGAKPIVFGDSKEGTFAVRLNQSLDAPQGVMRNSEGGEGEAQVWGKRANWVNVDGLVDGKMVGVAIFDSPSSFRHPTYWHARGYGLLAANPFGLSYFLNDKKASGSYTLPPGNTVKFAYRVVVHDGDYKQARIADRYRAYEGEGR